MKRDGERMLYPDTQWIWSISKLRLVYLHVGSLGSTLPPIIMEVENGVLEDVFSLQSRLFSTSMIMGGRVNVGKVDRPWPIPLPSNSHHQDYSIFSRESL